MQAFSFEPDYTGMRKITEDLYAALIAYLAKDEAVSLFQQLLLSKQAEQEEVPPDRLLAGDTEGGIE